MNRSLLARIFHIVSAMACVFEEESAFAILGGKEKAAIKQTAQVIALAMAHAFPPVQAVSVTLGTQGKSATISTVWVVEIVRVMGHVLMVVFVSVKKVT